MGRDGKLTRSLLPGALGAENKEKETDGGKEGGRQGRDRGREREEIASHIGDRLVRAMEALCAPLPAIETIYLSVGDESIARHIRIYYKNLEIEAAETRDVNIFCPLF